MLDIIVKNNTPVKKQEQQVRNAQAIRKHDITSWTEVPLEGLNARQKKRFQKHRTALNEYFTSDVPLEVLSQQHMISSESLLKMVEKCLMQHEDGKEWGYRALLPGIQVVDHAPPVPVQEESSEAYEESGEDSKNEAGKDEAHHVSDEISASDDSPTEEVVGMVKQLEVEEPAQAGDTAACIEKSDETAVLAPVKVTMHPIAVSTVTTVTSLPKLVKRYSDRHAGQIRRIVHRRWVRNAKTQARQHTQFHHMMALALVAAILLGIALPVIAGIAAYNVYTDVKDVATDGVNHLLTVKSLFPISKSDPMAALDAKKLQQAQHEFKSAEADFVQLQQLTNRPDMLSTVEEFSSDYANKLQMSRHLIQVALDVCHMGEEAIGVALIGANILHSSPLASGSNQPLISVSDIANIQGLMIHALYYVDDIQAQMHQVQLKELPISYKQRTQFEDLVKQLPTIRRTLTDYQGMVGVVSWLLGTGQERRFLVQTLDSAELRPSGGFTGQYGVVTVRDGRMGPFNLRDVALLDYAGNGVELGRQAPPEYRSWMNFGNWGLRDSNLSADYPTTAKMSMQVFQDEGGGPIDGDISFTPTFIGHILDVTGPIVVPDYHETITSKNLEERLHYYQQDYSAIAVEHQKSKDDSHAARKAFTSLVGKILLDRVRHLSTKQLIDVFKGIVKDLQSHDLEIYFANPLAEQWLIDHGYSASTDTFSRQDGFMVVQSNISISKASQYVHTTEHDEVTIDAQGGATHNLTITLDYRQTGPVYGFDTYADYIRVYVPQNAQLISGDGFDTGQALCTPNQPAPPDKHSPSPPPGSVPSGATGCSQYDSYFPSDARYCPDGNYHLGDRGFQQAWNIDSLGGPTATSSDLAGRAMFGGLTETPKNCVSYISLSWHVPHVVKQTPGQAPYTLLVQKQSGYIPTIELSVNADASPVKSMKHLDFKGNITEDKMIAYPAMKK